MTIYLCTSSAVEESLALAADGAIVLLQDAVTQAAHVPADRTCYALRDDFDRRGLTGQLPAHVEPIDYSRLVDLMFEHPVVNLG